MGALFLNPYVILGLVGVLTLSHGSAYWWGSHNAAKTCAIEKAEMREASQRQKEAELGRAIVAATTLEATNARTKETFRVITRSVDRVVEKPVYRDVCFDADGLLLANTALTGTSAPAAKPDAAVPGPVAP